MSLAHAYDKVEFAHGGKMMQCPQVGILHPQTQTLSSSVKTSEVGASASRVPPVFLCVSLCVSSSPLREAVL